MYWLWLGDGPRVTGDRGCGKYTDRGVSWTGYDGVEKCPRIVGEDGGGTCGCHVSVVVVAALIQFTSAVGDRR